MRRFITGQISTRSMKSTNWFTKLMKSKPSRSKPQRHVWTMDESKCLSSEEVVTLNLYSAALLSQGLKSKRFSLVRNWFMIELGLNSGLRVQEMTSLKHNSLYINGSRSSIFVVGKGNKKRSIWIGKRFKRICSTYIQHKEAFGYKDSPDSYLLNNIQGKRISKRALQKFFKQILEQSGLPSHYYIHCLRHTYSTFLLRSSNNNYRFVQKQLGHSSIKTTQIYAGIVEADGREAIDEMYVFTSESKGGDIHF